MTVRLAVHLRLHAHVSVTLVILIHLGLSHIDLLPVRKENVRCWDLAWIGALNDIDVADVELDSPLNAGLLRVIVLNNHLSKLFLTILVHYLFLLLLALCISAWSLSVVIGVISLCWLVIKHLLLLVITMRRLYFLVMLLIHRLLWLCHIAIFILLARVGPLWFRNVLVLHWNVLIRLHHFVPLSLIVRVNWLCSTVLYCLIIVFGVRVQIVLVWAYSNAAVICMLMDHSFFAQLALVLLIWLNPLLSLERFSLIVVLLFGWHHEAFGYSAKSQLLVLLA